MARATECGSRSCRGVRGVWCVHVTFALPHLFFDAHAPYRSFAQLPNVDPRTGIRDTAVPYKVLMKFRTGVAPENMNKPCFGCNGVPEGYGMIHVGDRMQVLEYVKEN